MGPTRTLCQSLLITLTPAISNVVARDIVFPPVSPMDQQHVMIMRDDMDIRTDSAFAGLLTYANVPYVHCLAPEGQEVEKYDIAILGAPFDTVSQSPVLIGEYSNSHRSASEKRGEVKQLDPRLLRLAVYGTCAMGNGSTNLHRISRSRI